MRFPLFLLLPPVFVSLMGSACGGEPPVSTRSPPRSTDLCDATGFESVEVERGVTQTLASGIRLRFEGMSYDHYENGEVDIIAHFRITAKNGQERSWLRDVRNESFAILFGHCLRVREARDERFVVDVGRLPEDS
ncbi:MAG: hypothetical protein AAF645_08085 [Myxococcota bacterium]